MLLLWLIVTLAETVLEEARNPIARGHVNATAMQSAMSQQVESETADESEVAVEANRERAVIVTTPSDHEVAAESGRRQMTKSVAIGAAAETERRSAAQVGAAAAIANEIGGIAANARGETAAAVEAAAIAAALPVGVAEIGGAGVTRGVTIKMIEARAPPAHLPLALLPVQLLLQG